MRVPTPEPTPEPAPTAAPFRHGFAATFRLEVAEALRATWFRIYAAVFFVLIGVLVFRPSGLIGERVAERA